MDVVFIIERINLYHFHKFTVWLVLFCEKKKKKKKKKKNIYIYIYIYAYIYRVGVSVCTSNLMLLGLVETNQTWLEASA